MQNKPHENVVFGIVTGLLVVGIIAKLMQKKPKPVTTNQGTIATARTLSRPFIITGVGRA